MLDPSNHPGSACAVKPSKPHRRSKLPLTVASVERILGSARSMPGELDGIPAGQWWPALILAIIDTGQHAAALLRLSGDAFDAGEGTLTLERGPHALHAHTANALEAIRDAGRAKLFPWPKDGGKSPFYMLYHDYRIILHRAGLPSGVKNPIGSLRSTAIDTPDVLDCIDPHRPFYPVPGQPKQKPRKRKPGKLPTGDAGEALYRIRDDSARTLRRFFEETYRPLRLPLASSYTVQKYRVTISLFSDFAACDATLDQLTEDRLDRFKVWCLGRMKAATANGYLRHLLALWRYAWRKHKRDDLPRDVDMLPVPKTIAEAWSPEEMGQLLKSAAETEGEKCGLPAGLWWPALILLLYDTGIRIGAALKVPSRNLDFDSRWLRVEADTQKQRAEQAFRLHPDTIEAIEAIYPERRELVFNWSYRSRQKTLYDPFNEILERAGLRTTAKDKFHKIRGTSATYLAEAIGEDEAVRHLGHSHPSVTRNYLDYTKIVRRVTAADVIPRPEWKERSA